MFKVVLSLPVEVITGNLIMVRTVYLWITLQRYDEAESYSVNKKQVVFILRT